MIASANAGTGTGTNKRTGAARGWDAGLGGGVWRVWVRGLGRAAAAMVVVMVGMLELGGRAVGLDAAAANRMLGRGINLGNALEAPEEGAWGMRLEAGYFTAIKAAGFQSVRIPMRWSAHAGREAPYAVEGGFRERAAWAVDAATAAGLVVVLNLHHYEELYADPGMERARFLGIWRQVAGQFRDRPETVYFELLNEPHGKLTEEIWNGLLVEALGVVRASNPERMVIVGPGRWNNPAQLPSLVLPGGDRSLIVTFHYYSPFEFTHQGASWVGANPPPLGRRWAGGAEERAAVGRDFAAAAAWAKAAGRPLYVGEFGAYEKADMGSRALWTRVVREEAEKHGMSWAYWEFGSGFGAYDRGVGAWREPLLDALVGK